MYRPLCAFACRDILSTNRLACSTTNHEDKAKRHNDQVEFETSAHCYAEDNVYLLSLAQCIETHCSGLAERWELDRFWALDAVGSQSVQPQPAYAFDEALQSAQNHTDEAGRLPSVATLHGTLTIVSEVSGQDWQMAFSSISDSVYVEERHSQYGILLIVLIIVIPLAVHLLRLVRLPTLWERKTVALLGHSALFGKRHAVPLPYDLGVVPTRGQAAFITSMIVLNLCLLLIGYRVAEPNIYGQTASYRFLSHMANRAGILSFANLTLMMLCCGRNNLAVRFTKWSYSTMLLYHRWIAHVCIFEALVHGTIHFIHHIPYLAHKFTQAYWNLGVITVGLMCVVVPLSALAVRKRAYELFVDSHVVLSFFVVLGCYHHIYMKFQHEWGYENWVYLAAFLWAGDRLLRTVKLLGGGIRTAVITHIDDEYARIDIPGVKASGHVYLYFPGLSWRPWQNHPFSIAASVHESISSDDHAYEETASNEETGSEHQRPLLAEKADDQNQLGALKRESSSSSLASLLAEGSGRSSSTALEKPDVTPWPHGDGQSGSPQSTGLTFYIRRQRGITAQLFDSPHQAVKVLVEGPYRPLPIPNIAACATLVCIAGGVGISAVLPALRSHCLVGRSVLYWGCRSQALVDAVDMDAFRRAGVEIHVKINARWIVHEIVSEEARATLPLGDVIVLASGPNEMADDVRAAVVRANLTMSHAGRGRVRLVEESFSW
ncbi:hypothetical protein M409DRAFT_36173 [Zasmidium cellare ATCC 36951]|uniref:FAD-binding FR-type domain-containing protein n=1 Tax=Zasmidium cellare ATCC 36951 TaxID=1080233 RepID=A0A6A6CUK9_ZASCE|nr:uncharacterized protein M409DRAFT_36173 [Zasmidium cellare ATCC 36951]KAF2169489.1 hypothetical protein M409DRAFT_36173 [Zasmidium cellare ATCC 36951]